MSPSSEYFFGLPQDTAGLELGSVTAVVQSRDGFLWLATYNGLARFDGVRFTVFNSGATPGLRNNRLTALFPDEGGTLWIGHETGELTRFSGGEFLPVSLGPGWPGGPIEAINMDRQGDLWLANNRGALFRLRDGRLLASLPNDPNEDWAPSWMVRDQRRELWVVSRGAVGTIQQGEFVRAGFDANEKPGEHAYERAFPALDGGMWILRDGRIAKWRQGRWIADLGPLPWSLDFATALLETRSGALLAGTIKSGLFLFPNGGPSLHFTHTNGLSSDRVRCLFEDREGNIWVGTSGGGLQTLRSRKARLLSPPDGWQGHQVLSFAVRPDGSAWIGTEGAGLYHFQGGRWSSYNDASGLPSAFVWSVLQTRKGELFVGTWGGGLVAESGGRFAAPGELKKLTAPILALYEGHDGELWIGTTIGLCRYQAGRLAWVATSDKLSVPDVRAIAEGPDGTLWFGMSGGGLGALKDGALRQFRKADGLGSDFVFCLYPDPDGTLWIGTIDNGLTRLRDGKFATIGAEQGLPNHSIHHLVDDGAGYLWLGTQRGILRVAKSELHQCANGSMKSVRYLSYGNAEGLASQSCPGGFQPGACRAADGRLWFPTTKGLAIIDPARVSINPLPPPVVIEQLLVDGLPAEAASADKGWRIAESASPSDLSFARPPSASPARSARPLRIGPGRQRFEFQYTGLSFVAPDRVRFKYRLEGLESQWIEAGTRRAAHYSYLRPGAYRFQVTACNNDDVWNESPATLAFTVLPRFWQTLGFQVAALASAIGAVGGGARWLVRRRWRRRLEQLEKERAVERERERIARDIHDDLGASLTRITMLSQTVRGELAGESPGALAADQVNRTARELTRAMDEIVWVVNPKHDTLDSLATYLVEFAQDFLNTAGIRCRLDIPVHLPAWNLTAETRHNLFLAFKEVLHNVVKHAGATEVRISLQPADRAFALIITDNGRGFDARPLQDRAAPQANGTRPAGGNGLLNLRRRLAEIGGDCEWDTTPGNGTRVKLQVEVK